MLVLDALARLLAPGALGDHGRLGWLLGSLPGLPGFQLNAVEFLKFSVTRFIEVANGRLSTLLVDGLNVLADGGLSEAELLSNGHLGPALDIQVGDLFTPAGDLKLFRSV